MANFLWPPWTVAHQAPLSMGFPRKNTGMGCHFRLQGIFLTQGSNQHLQHWQADSFNTEPPGKLFGSTVFYEESKGVKTLSYFRRDMFYTHVLRTLQTTALIQSYSLRHWKTDKKGLSEDPSLSWRKSRKKEKVNPIMQRVSLTSIRPEEASLPQVYTSIG